MNEKAQILVEQMKRYFIETDSEDPIESEFSKEIAEIDIATLLAEIFIVCKSSLADKLVIDLPLFLKKLEYKDIVKAFALMQDDELAIFYFSSFVAEMFGINPHQLAKQHADLSRVLCFIERSFREGQGPRPTDWSVDYLKERGLNQEKMIQQMKEQAAPMLGEKRQVNPEPSYSQLSDEEKHLSRLNHIRLAEKFRNEGVNKRKLVYMPLYLDFLCLVRELTLQKNGKAKYEQLLSYLNSFDFVYHFKNEYACFCQQDESLKELFSQLARGNPFTKENNDDERKSL